MSTFVGSYVTEVRDALFACMASGLHVQFVGKPGTGKTAISYATANAVYGEEMSMTRFNPSASIEKVEGYQDFKAWMEQSEWKIITDGTPYDPKCRLWIADEWNRANSAIQDKFIDTLDRWDDDPINSPVVVGTANFLPKDERSEAVLDRFGLTYWIAPNGDFTARDVAQARLKANNTRLLVPGLENEPDRKMWREAIDFARSVAFSDKAIDVVGEATEHVEKVANEGLVNGEGEPVRSFGPINNRRRTYWADLLARTTALYTNSGDFDTVHPKAMQALAFAWTSKSQEEADDWRLLMGNVVDPIQSAIDQSLMATYILMAEEAKGKSYVAIANDLAKIIQRTSDNLKTFVAEDDPRYRQAVYELQKYMTQYIREAGNVSE